eukprot:TRINITY_DN994_c0_g1_i1.p1 TRINITY_DN994_c0_g1~~TRINITY_DN994_c0_g1_i1.p1  ORF type:complete len:464 (+),score=106.50 TRINITY_DN994_c0_g1_i1:70-1392(+)
MHLLTLLSIPILAMRPRIAVDGAPDMDLPPNKDIKIPSYIQHYTDDDFYMTLKKADVLVMYLREGHCPDCDFYAEHFYNATEQVHKLDGVEVGQIDIHDEGDLFADWHGVEEDIPALLVFKSEESVRYRKKPIQFVVNSRIGIDLPPFVKRMRGPTYRTINDQQEFDKFLEDTTEFGDGVGFTINLPDPSHGEKPRKLATTLSNRVAEKERFNSVFGLVTYGDRDLKQPSLTSYDTSVQPPAKAVFDIPLQGDFKKTVRSALLWIHGEKTKRAGHRYDNMVSYFADDLFVPQNHTDAEKVTDDKKKYVKAVVVGKSSHTKTVVLNREIEFVTQENQTMSGIERGIVGMSVGMKRMLVLPPEWRSGWKFGVIELHESSQLLLELTVLHIGETNELPGRIEWETDPEKIAEHKRKVAEDEKRRQDAIDRGEDPDAECKASQE